MKYQWVLEVLKISTHFIRARLIKEASTKPIRCEALKEVQKGLILEIELISVDKLSDSNSQIYNM